MFALWPMRSTVIWSIDRPRIDVEQVVHERAWRRIADRAERQRRARAHHVLEPIDRLGDVGHGEADMIDADEAELATTAACAAGACR